MADHHAHCICPRCTYARNEQTSGCADHGTVRCNVCRLVYAAVNEAAVCGCGDSSQHEPRHPMFCRCERCTARRGTLA